MAVYTLPSPKPFRPAAPGIDEVSGEDILLTDQLLVSSGDWRTVRGADAAEQSVRREASANVGALLRRPEWGMGVTQFLFKGVTRTNSEAMISRVRRRMRENPRVGRFVKAEIFKMSSASGSAISIEYEPVGVRRPISTIVKGAR